jgi:hypothetical protein
MNLLGTGSQDLPVGTAGGLPVPGHPAYRDRTARSRITGGSSARGQAVRALAELAGDGFVTMSDAQGSALREATLAACTEERKFCVWQTTFSRFQSRPATIGPMRLRVHPKIVEPRPEFRPRPKGTHGRMPRYTRRRILVKLCQQQEDKKPLTCGNTVPEVGLELHSRP